ncbi:hypothetical protein [Leucobacter sp. USHLN153]|uniref:hypothetical protein n=1 Tax=Leucobacter sp. USHLN153 TaxID=3081268 RepID=UPI003017B314
MSAPDDAGRIRLVRAIFPDLAGELDAALARHGNAQGSAGGDAFDAWLDDEVERVIGESLGAVGFADVDDEVQRARFERAFEAARRAAAWAGVELPQPEAFALAGANLARLGAALAADDTLVPVPAPYGLGTAGWRRAFERAADESSAFGTQGDASPLVLASEAEREFSLLDQAPAAVHFVRERSGAVRGWTLRLVPAAPAPAVVGLSFEHGPHLTLPEMLMLQLMRAAEGEPLVDARTFTWLAHPLADGVLAARHVYDESERAIRISCRETGNQGPHLGARPPIA